MATLSKEDQTRVLRAARQALAEENKALDEELEALLIYGECLRRSIEAARQGLVQFHGRLEAFEAKVPVLDHEYLKLRAREGGWMAELDDLQAAFGKWQAKVNELVAAEKARRGDVDLDGDGKARERKAGKREIQQTPL